MLDDRADALSDVLALPLGRRRCGMSDLGSAVRRRPLLSVVIVTHLVYSPSDTYKEARSVDLPVRRSCGKPRSS